MRKTASRVAEEVMEKCAYRDKTALSAGFVRNILSKAVGKTTRRAAGKGLVPSREVGQVLSKHPKALERVAEGGRGFRRGTHPVTGKENPWPYAATAPHEVKREMHRLGQSHAHSSGVPYRRNLQSGLEQTRGTKLLPESTWDSLKKYL